jgi:hypothetical protein
VTADDDYHWICEQCFADLREKFNWTVVPSAELPISHTLFCAGRVACVDAPDRAI